MTKRVRIIVIAGAAVGVCVGYAWFFGFATWFAAEARYVAWKMPVVKIAPVELTDLSTSTDPGQRLSYLGYQFEVPWSDLNEARVKQVGEMQIVAFRSGRSILSSNVPPREFVDTVLSSAKANAESPRSLYRDGGLKSDYLLMRAILQATPSRVGLFSSRQEAVGNSMLLMYKGIMMPRGAESGIFHIHAGNYQGFQFGDPKVRSKFLDVEMFSEDDGFALIFCQAENGPMQPITQAEINRVVQTVRRATGSSRPSGGS